MSKKFIILCSLLVSIQGFSKDYLVNNLKLTSDANANDHSINNIASLIDTNNVELTWSTNLLFLNGVPFASGVDDNHKWDYYTQITNKPTNLSNFTNDLNATNFNLVDVPTNSILINKNVNESIINIDNRLENINTSISNLNYENTSIVSVNDDIVTISSISQTNGLISLDWNTNAVNLSKVAKSGDYEDLINTPDLYSYAAKSNTVQYSYYNGPGWNIVDLSNICITNNLYIGGPNYSYYYFMTNGFGYHKQNHGFKFYENNDRLSIDYNFYYGLDELDHPVNWSGTLQVPIINGTHTIATIDDLDNHKWDYNTQVTNTPDLSGSITNIVVNNFESTIKDKTANITLDALIADESNEVYSIVRGTELNFYSITNYPSGYIDEIKKCNNIYFYQVNSTSETDLLISTNGIDWIKNSFPDPVTSIAYDNGLYILGSYSGLYSSTDLINWELLYDSKNKPINKKIISVTYGDKFVALCDDGSDLSVVINSDDGITWTKRSQAYDISSGKLVYVNGIYYLINSIDGATLSYYSLDGIIFNYINDISIYYIIYENNKFIAGTFNGLYYSIDGIDWIGSNISEDSHAVDDLIFDGTKYVASILNRIYISYDGITWNDIAYGFRVGYSSGVYISWRPSDGIYYSTDLLNWNKSIMHSNLSQNFTLVNFCIDGNNIILDIDDNANSVNLLYGNINDILDSSKPLATKEYVNNHIPTIATVTTNTIDLINDTGLITAEDLMKLFKIAMTTGIQFETNGPRYKLVSQDYIINNEGD